MTDEQEIRELAAIAAAGIYPRLDGQTVQAAGLLADLRRRLEAREDGVSWSTVLNLLGDLERGKAPPELIARLERLIAFIEGKGDVT